MLACGETTRDLSDFHVRGFLPYKPSPTYTQPTSFLHTLSVAVLCQSDCLCAKN